jgi:hypothetical protein
MDPASYWLDPPEELRDLAAAVRVLMERMVVIDESHEELRSARTAVLDIAKRLETIGRTGPHPRSTRAVGPDDARPFYSGNARAWDYNPINPRLAIDVGPDGTLTARTTLGLPYEGPPHCVHGGIIAHLFDQILGYANVVHGFGAVTSALTIRYLRPTPLGTELRFDVQRARVDGRRVVTRATLTASEVVTAEGQGLFVVPEPGKWRAPTT